MIKVGQRREAKYWGEYYINKVAELPKPEISYTPQWGRTCFRPTIAEIQWENGKKVFWFPYWIGPEGKERFGQYAPMIEERLLLALFKEAITQEFFSPSFLSDLAEALSEGNSRAGR